VELAGDDAEASMLRDVVVGSPAQRVQAVLGRVDERRDVADGQVVLDAALRDELAVAQARGVAAAGAEASARRLLQNDAWERFESLGKVEPDHAAAPIAEALPRRVAALIRALAGTEAEAHALPSNLGAASRDFPAELGRIDDPSAWLEVRTIYRDGPPGAALRTGARHDLVAGFRMAFRVLARPPEGDAGSAWRATLGEGEPADLPAGTRLALLGSPLAVTIEGRAVPTRVVSVIEARGIVAEPLPPFRERPLDVFEAAPAKGAAELPLHRVPPDELIPMGASCAPTVGNLVPLRAACGMCHARPRLLGPMSHGDTAFEVETDPLAASRRVAAEKATKAELAELVRLWGP
jgi:hypothetical protein